MKANVYERMYYKTIDNISYCIRLHKEYGGEKFVLEARYKVNPNDKKSKEKLKFFTLMDPANYYIDGGWRRYPLRKEGKKLATYFLTTLIDEMNEEEDEHKKRR